MVAEPAAMMERMEATSVFTCSGGWVVGNRLCVRRMKYHCFDFSINEALAGGRGRRASGQTCDISESELSGCVGYVPSSHGWRMQ